MEDIADWGGFIRKDGLTEKNHNWGHQAVPLNRTHLLVLARWSVTGCEGPQRAGASADPVPLFYWC